MNKVICLFGPTCSGKTPLSIDIAEKFGLSIISADSIQVYKKITEMTDEQYTEEITRKKGRYLLNKILTPQKKILENAMDEYYVRIDDMHFLTDLRTAVQKLDEKIEREGVQVSIDYL